MIGADSIGLVLDVLRPERRALLELLSELDADQWSATTECPEFTVKGIATHLLGDDLSLLSRQRDGAASGLVGIAQDRPGAEFRELLAIFNERWVTAAEFFSVEVLVELLELSGGWTAAYYERVDPAAPGEHVEFFGGTEASSPYWHWLLGAVDLGRAQQAADVLTWAHTGDEIRSIVVGPLEEVNVLGSFGARP